MPVGAQPVTPVFTVNSEADDSPFGNAASIVRLPSGGFIMFWSEGTPNDGSLGCVQARIFDANGVAAGPQFIVNTATANGQAVPDAILLADGNVMVTWQDGSLTGGDNNSNSVKGQVFSPAGVRIGGEFLVNTTTTGSQGFPNNILLDNGNVMIFWQDTSLLGGDASGSAIKGQIVTASGVKVGGEFLVNTETLNGQNTPHVAKLSNGNVVVTWQDLSGTLGDASGNSIKAQILDSTGAKVGVEFLVNTETAGTQTAIDMIALANGNFVVTWQDASGTLGDADSTSIKAQIFNAQGQKVGTEFLVNTTTAGGQGTPTIAVVGDNFVIAWRHSVTIDGISQQSFRGQAFRIDGTRLGDEFAAGPVSPIIGNPSITGLGGNQFVIAGPYSTLVGPLQVSQGERAQIFSLFNEIVGTPAAETLTGTAGYDYITGLGDADLLYGLDGSDAIEGGDGNDIIVGGVGDDELDGGADDDYLIGGDGDDAMNGGGGTNTLQGGIGDDFYEVSSQIDSVIEATGEGEDTVTAYLTQFVLSANIENLIAGLANGFLGIGNNLDNVITGATGARDELYGREGNDMLFGGDGPVGSEDTLLGGTGDDDYLITVLGTSTVEYAGEGHDTVRTAFSIYSLQANIEDLRVTAGGDYEALVGNDLDNFIEGEAGRDNLFGRAGNDTLSGNLGAANSLFGQEGDDTYVVKVVGDSVVEFAGEGIDRVLCHVASFVLPDHAENLIYSSTNSFTGIGNAAGNVIEGGLFADFLSGLDGDDILIGKGGSDTLLGGAGADTFRYVGRGPDGENGFDRILDFTSGTDRISLSSATYGQTLTFELVQGGTPIATTANSTFLYNVNTGMLTYDADGVGAGLSVGIAQLNAGLTLTVGDFVFF